MMHVKISKRFTAS